MKYNDIIKYLDNDIECYKDGRFTIQELLHVVERDIYRETNNIYDTDKRIKLQNKLYKHFFKTVVPAVNFLEKHG